MIVIQVDPEVPVSVRKSLEERDANFRKSQVGGSLPREAAGSENFDKKLTRSNLARPLSRPTSASGHVPSIIMLTSVDHSDASRYSFNFFLPLYLLRGKCVRYIQLHSF